MWKEVGAGERQQSTHKILRLCYLPCTGEPTAQRLELCLQSVDVPQLSAVGSYSHGSSQAQSHRLKLRCVAATSRLRTRSLQSRVGWLPVCRGLIFTAAYTALHSINNLAPERTRTCCPCLEHQPFCEPQIGKAIGLLHIEVMLVAL